MCVTVIKNGQSYETRGELKMLLGLSELPGESCNKQRSIYKDGDCLCSVDIPSLAASVGMVAKLADHCMWYELEGIA